MDRESYSKVEGGMHGKRQEFAWLKRQKYWKKDPPL